MAFKPESARQLNPLLTSAGLGAMNFLNEINARYPAAISFAPGAPNPQFYSDAALLKYYDYYVNFRAVTRESSNEEERIRTLEYGPAQGIICDLVASSLTASSIASVRAQEVVITVGAQEGLILALRSLFWDPADVLLVTEPFYPGVVGAAKLLGIEVWYAREVDHYKGLSPFEIRTIEAGRQGRRIKAIYVAPDFANPSGKLMSSSERQSLSDFARKNAIFLIEDTAYSFTAQTVKRPKSLFDLSSDGSTLQVGTFSKIAYPGLRVGYVAASDRIFDSASGTTLAQSITLAKSMVTVNTSPISQAIVGGMLLQHGSLMEMAETRSARYKSNLAHLVDCLDNAFSEVDRSRMGLAWSRPKGGFFVCLTLSKVVDEQLLLRSAEEFGVLWTPMRYFYESHQGDHSLRLSCSYLDKDEISEGVERLSSFIRAILD